MLKSSYLELKIKFTKMDNFDILVIRKVELYHEILSQSHFGEPDFQL